MPTDARLGLGLLLGGLLLLLAYPKFRSACAIWDTGFAHTVLVQPADHLGRQRVRFFVTNKSGAPGVGRTIEYHHNSGLQQVTTDERGVADLEPGEWGLERIVLDGHMIQERRWTYMFFRPSPSRGLEVRITLE